MPKLIAKLLLLCLLVVTACGEDPKGDVQSGMAFPEQSVLVSFDRVAARVAKPGEYRWTVEANGELVLKLGLVSNEGEGNLFTVGDFKVNGKSSLTILCQVKETDDTNGKHCAVDVEVKLRNEEGDFAYPVNAMVPPKDQANAAMESIQSYVDSEQLIRRGSKGVLAWWQSRNDRDTWMPDGAKEGLEVYIEGKGIPIKKYEFPAWALWLEVK